IGHARWLTGDVELDPVAGREHGELVAGEGSRQGVEPVGALAVIEGQGLAHRGGRRPVIDPDGQQLHSALPAAAAAVDRLPPCPVCSPSTSTPTHVNTRKANATIVRIMTPRPRIAGRKRAWSRMAKTSHIARALTTLG